MSWYWEPLSKPTKSVIDIQLGQFHIDEEKYFDMASNRLASLRPEAAAWLDATLHRGVISDILHVKPATEIVYEWLWDDLARKSWVNGLLGSPSYDEI